jgi:hypothetical protein
MESYLVKQDYLIGEEEEKQGVQEELIENTVFFMLFKN